jgi:flagellar biosynthesis protein FliR
MGELIPVMLGAIFGAVIWLTTTGKLRFALSVAAVIVSGAAATIASGEYHESWIYLLLDFGEAAFGLVIGYVIASRLPALRTASRRGVTRG